MSIQHAQQASRSTQRAALIVSGLTSFLGPFMGSSVNVALPAIGSDLDMTAVLLGWVNQAFLLASAAFSIPFGRLGDIYGRKKIYMAGVAVFTIASVLIALTPSAVLLILCRGIQGFGAGMIFTTGMAILVSVYPPRQRGKALGINVAAVYLGLSSGPFIGGIITEHLGWRFLFWINLPIGVLLLAIIFTLLKGEWAEDENASFDFPGSAILIVTLALTMYAFSGLPRPSALVLLVVGLAGLVFFAVFEQRRQSPLVDIRLFTRNRVFALSSLAALINYAATFAVTFLLSLYLQKIRDLSPQQAGLVLVSQPIIQTLLSPYAGRLSDRLDPGIVASIGMGLCFIGLILLNMVGARTSIYYLIFCLTVLGLGFAFFSSPNTKAIMGAVERRDFGVASAVVGTMRQVGMTFSMGIVMIIISLHLGETDIDPTNAQSFVSSMKTAFTVFALMCFGGIFASLARSRPRG